MPVISGQSAISERLLMRLRYTKRAIGPSHLLLESMGESLFIKKKKKKRPVHHHQSFHYLISYICWSWQKCNTHSFLSREREEEAYSHRFGCVTVFTSYFFYTYLVLFKTKQKNTFTLEINVLISVPLWILLAEEDWCFPLVW